MTLETTLTRAGGVFVLLVLLSILVNPTSRNPLDWLWPPTFYARVKAMLDRPNYVRIRTVDPVLGLRH